MHGQCNARLTVTFPAAEDCHCLTVFISHAADGRMQSWPEWLVTYQDGETRSPMSVLTGLDIQYM